MWQPIETLPEEGQVLVYLSEPMLGSNIHTMRCGNMPVIGCRFSWDVKGEIINWMPQPDPPKAEAP